MLSWGTDGTVRLWDLNGKTTFNELRTERVLWVKNKRNLRTSVTAARFQRKGKVVYAVEQSGSLQWFDLRSSTTSHRPDGIVPDAHSEGGASTMALSPDKRTLVTRGRLDDTVKVWDSRKQVKPVMTFNGITNTCDTSGVGFRPDGRLLVRAHACAVSSARPVAGA